MSDVKHTPGPWQAWSGFYVTDEAGLVICDVRHIGVMEAGANMDLIAAAPDLLAALKYALEYVDENAADMTRILPAIAKAEGR